MGCRQNKSYAGKAETIDALKDNIREAYGEIQLHIIDNAEGLYFRKKIRKYLEAFSTQKQLFGGPCMREGIDPEI